jgi:ribulose kinase
MPCLSYQQQPYRVARCHVFTEHVCASVAEDCTCIGLSTAPDIAVLARDVHVYPDVHGNRSPLADAYMTGAITGITLDHSLDAVAVLYLATMQGIACGTRDIVEAMRAQGAIVKEVVACGGLAHNPVFLQQHADILGMPVLLPTELDAMLLGCAVVRSLR